MNKYKTENEVYKNVKKLTGKGYEFIVDKNGNKWWYLNGKLHRENGPAIEYADGTKVWYLNDNYYGNKEPDNWICLVIEYRLMK